LTGQTIQELKAYVAEEKKMVRQMDSSNTAQAEHIQAKFSPERGAESEAGPATVKAVQAQQHMVTFVQIDRGS